MQRPPKNRRSLTASTWMEIVVSVGVGVVLLLIVMNIPRGRKEKSTDQMPARLTSMRVLWQATQNMAADRATNHNPSLGWPGDTGGTFSNWTQQIVQGRYLSTNELTSLLSGPGKKIPRDAIPTMTESALLLYAAKGNSPANTVFLSTANFTNTTTGGVLNPSAKPYGNKGFVVFRRGGDGAVLLSSQAGDTSWSPSKIASLSPSSSPTTASARPTPMSTVTR